MVQDVNLSGVFYSLRAELRVITEGGSIVNLSSLAGLNGFPTQVSYCASKHGVIGLTKTAAREAGARKVRVNALCPGLIDTPLLRGPQSGDSSPNTATAAALEAFQSKQAITHRIGDPGEVANLIDFLLSDAASWMTGAAIPIDGGIEA